MSKFKSYAESGNFRDYLLEAPDQTAKIEQQTQRTLRGMQRAQDFLQENNRLYLQAQKLAQGREEAQRETNFQLETEARQAYKDALRRDYEIETQNDRIKAQQQKDTFDKLTSFAKGFAELSLAIDAQQAANSRKDNARRAYAAGADLQTVAAIQQLGSNLTRAEFSQIEFIRRKLDEGGDVDALFALYENRNTRGFINNIAVAQNTAFGERARIDIELNKWRQENLNATPDEIRAQATMLYREASANVGQVGDRQLNSDLMNQYVFDILRRGETATLQEIERGQAEYRKNRLNEDVTRALNQAWTSGGAAGVMTYIYNDPSSAKFEIFTNWMVNKSKDPSEMGLDPEQMGDIIDFQFPASNRKDANGDPQLTSYRQSRSGRADLAKIIEAQRIAFTNRTAMSRAQDQADKDALEDAIKIRRDEMTAGGDGILDADEQQELEEMEAQIPDFESKTLKFIKENDTADAKSNKVGVDYLQKQYEAGNLKTKTVEMLPLSPEVKKEWLEKAKTQETFYTQGAGKGHIDAIKQAVKGAQFVKISPVTGAASWTAKSYMDKRVALYKKLVEESKAIPGMTPDAVYSKVIQETNEFLGNPANFDLTGGSQTGEIKSELEAVKEGVGEFGIQAIQYREFNKAMNNPAFKTDAAFAGASMGAENIAGAIKQMSEGGQTPDMVRTAALAAGKTPYEFINWVAEGAGMPTLELHPIAQKMAEAANNPITKRLYTNPTPYRTKRANQWLFGGGFNQPGIPMRPAFDTNTPSVPPASIGNDQQRAALEAIAGDESGGFGYDAVNQGGSKEGTKVLGYSGRYSEMPTARYKMPLTDLNLGQVLEQGEPRYSTLRTAKDFQDAGGIHAAGKYQIIHNTLKGLVERHNLPLNAKFSPQLQDWLALSLLNSSGDGQWIGPDEAARQIIKAGRGFDLGDPPITY